MYSLKNRRYSDSNQICNTMYVWSWANNVFITPTSSNQSYLPKCIDIVSIKIKYCFVLCICTNESHNVLNLKLYAY